jgi:hypothetical protein
MAEDSIQKYHQHIINQIFSIRHKQVMIDEHLAELYGIETKYLNRAVKRNPDRFYKAFMFQLTKEEYEDLRCQSGTSNESDSLRFQSGTSNKRGGRRYFPYAFTEQGVAMLSAVLNSEIAVKMHVFDAANDRFLLIDKTEVYHIGASLKDLGKKWFAFSKMEKDSLVIFEKSGI